MMTPLPIGKTRHIQSGMIHHKGHGDYRVTFWGGYPMKYGRAKTLEDADYMLRSQMSVKRETEND